MIQRCALMLIALMLVGSSGLAFEFTQCGDTDCHWDQWPVRYYINQDGTPDLDNEFEIVEKSFARWESEHQTFCGIEFEYGGTTSVKTAEADGKNVVFWVEQGWTYGPDVLALTQCFYNANGVFLDCDIAVNGQNYTWDVGEDGGVSDIDLRGTLTHEIGHLWGLDHTTNKTATMYTYYDAGSNASDLDFDDIAGAWDTFCTGELPQDDSNEPDDTRVLAEDWSEGLALTGLRLYDDDWFRLSVPAGKRVKVEVLDEDFLRNKQIYLADFKGDMIDVQPCDGDCAVALGQAQQIEEVRNVVVRGEFDVNPIQTDLYDIRVTLVDPGEEGELYDDDDAAGDGGCGCDPFGSYAGIRPGSGSDTGLWLLAALFALAVGSTVRFARK